MLSPDVTMNCFHELKEGFKIFRLFDLNGLWCILAVLMDQSVAHETKGPKFVILSHE